MKTPTRIHIGTSGWDYSHWKGPFYPKDCAHEERFRFYTRHLSTVEINRSFYKLPDRSTFAGWRDDVPKRFVFALKASRYLTHMKKLKDPRAPLRKFLRRVEVLRDRLGPILFQLPPRWKCNPERLRAFLEALPDKHRYAFEFRNSSWFQDEVYDLLAESDAAFCIFELAGKKSPRKVTTDLVYVRLHGPGRKAYQGRYTPQALAGWARVIRRWRRQGKTVFCYFDNDQKGYAAQNAQQLQEMLAK